MTTNPIRNPAVPADLSAGAAEVEIAQCKIDLMLAWTQAKLWYSEIDRLTARLQALQQLRTVAVRQGKRDQGQGVLLEAEG